MIAWLANLPAVLMSILATGAGMAGKTFWMPEQASRSAPEIDFVFNFITWLCIFFFVLIVVLMVVFVARYRRTRPDQNATTDITHHTPLELTWTIVPLILVIAIFYVGMRGYIELRTVPLDVYQIDVTGQQWSWSIEHPNGLVEANNLLVPVGKPVKLVMTSSDVLHSFYIPAFRVKQDVVPGRYTYLWFEATKPGIYPLMCTEYCGKDHSMMVGTVEVVEQDEFDAEVAARANFLRDYTEEEFAQYGAQYAANMLFARCSSCHNLDGRPGGTGPTWKGLWAKLEKGEEVFTDGSKLGDIMGPGKTYENPEDYIRQSILNPGKHVVAPYNNAMPSFAGQLKDRQVTALIRLIQHIDQYTNPDGTIKKQDVPKPAKSAGEPAPDTTAMRDDHEEIATRP